MKIVSFNVNGIRAISKKNFFNDFTAINPDILCVQETKAQDNQVSETLEGISDYHLYSNSAIKKGYSGTAVLTKKKPINVSHGIGVKEHDTEGRVLCLEYKGFYLVNVYVPNSGSELKRLDYRQEWDLAFFNYLKELESNKPVVVCGDFNVAHTDIDLARPKQNYNKSAGFIQKEIDGLNRFLDNGFVDTFRHFYPTKVDAYSWWSYRAGARAKNIGWRIDYFLVSESLLPAVKKASIMNDILGSDHCPVSINLNEI